MLKKVFLVMLMTAAIVPPVEAQVQVGIHIPFLNFGEFSRPETVVATYFKQVDDSVVWLDLNARHTAVVEPNTTFRLSWQESKISWILSGSDRWGYGGYGYGSRGYARQIRFTANVCPADAVIREETKPAKKGSQPSILYGCSIQKLTFSSGDFVVSDPRYFPQQVNIIYFCGSWAAGYWISQTGCPVAGRDLSATAVSSATAPVAAPTPSAQVAAPIAAAPASAFVPPQPTILFDKKYFKKDWQGW